MWYNINVLYGILNAIKYYTNNITQIIKLLIIYFVKYAYDFKFIHFVYFIRVNLFYLNIVIVFMLIF